MLGLPARVRACLFDLDGVLTPTVKAHAAAWKEMFDERIDAVVARERGLRGTPTPDTSPEAARAPAVGEDGTAVFEDALAGVEAGRAGRFGLVVGVDRVGQTERLRAHGANVGARDLAELLESR
ncbi:hypothetical protein [Streptomyces collinus]|uniref:hypothetical protein n=1 Tax=Streptomyces collinus TaxID=42684 RepID=UPI003330B080